MTRGRSTVWEPQHCCWLANQAPAAVFRLSVCTYVLSCGVDTDLPAWAAVQPLANIAVFPTAAWLIACGGVFYASLAGAATLQATAHLRTAAGPTG